MGKQFDAIGFEIVIRFKDHGPPHVHAVRGRDDVKIGLDPVEIIRRKGRIRRNEEARLILAVKARKEDLTHAWREIYGTR